MRGATHGAGGDSSSDRADKGTKRRRSYRARFEQLEDRRVMSGWGTALAPMQLGGIDSSIAAAEPAAAPPAFHTGLISAFSAAADVPAEDDPPESFLIPAAGRMDMVHDAKRGLVYVSTIRGDLLTYDLSEQRFIKRSRLGSQLMGIDIAPNQDILAIADYAIDGWTGWIHVVDLTTGAARKIAFPSEGGSYSVAFADDRTVLATTDYFKGSGGVDLLKIDVVTGEVIVLGPVNQKTMLASSADHSMIAFAEANTSSAFWGSIDAATGSINRSKVDSFAFEVGVSRDASQYAVVGSTGTFFFDAGFNQVGTLGSYNSHTDVERPVGIAYSPTSDVVYVAWQDTDDSHAVIEAYSTRTLEKVATIDDGAAFTRRNPWAFVEGRLRISADGAMLFATVPGGVKVYQLAEPGRPPEITDVSATWLAAEQQAVTLTAEFSGVDLGDQHTAIVEWGDGTLSTATVTTNGTAGTITADHSYWFGGIYDVKVAVVDQSGTRSEATTQTVVTGAGVHDGVLQVVGTEGNDRVSIARRSLGMIEVAAGFLPTRDRSRPFAASGVDRIEVHLFGGNDTLSVSASMKSPLVADGGDGNDWLSAGGGTSVLLGGAGRDVLRAGRSRSLLMGGADADQLFAGANQDILIGGITAYDSIPGENKLAHVRALVAMTAEWDSRRDLATRQRNLLGGNGSDDRLNEGYFLALGQSVEDDLASDRVQGAARYDWWIRS